MKLLLTIIALTFSLQVIADTASKSFTAPTSREDGTVMDITEIAGFNIFINKVMIPSTDTLPPGPAGQSETLPASATDFTINVLPGNHILNMTTIDTDGRESVFSPDILVNVLANPSPPNTTGNSVIIKITFSP